MKKLILFLKNHWAGIAFFIFLFSALIFPIQDGDIFMYLAIARESWELGRIPTVDPFLYTFRDWNIFHEWLSYFFWYGFYILGGLAGVTLFKATLWLISFFWIYAQKGFRQATEPFTLVILFLAAKASSHRFVEKSSLFSDLLSVIVLCSLLQAKPPWKKLRWIFPILFLLGVNLHPGFVVAMAWLGAFLFCQTVTERKWPTKEALQTLFFSIFACFLNPLSWQGLIYPFHTVLKEEWNLYRKMNYEWLPTFQSPFLETWEVRALIGLITIVTLQLLWHTWKGRKNILFHWVVYILLMYFAISANRFIATSSLGLSVLAISLSDNILQFKNIRLKLAANLTLGILFTLGAVIVGKQGYGTAAGPRTFKFGIDENMMPIYAAQEFKNKKWQGRIFNEFGWGSYLAWELKASHSLFIHGHIDDPRFLANNYFAVGRSLEEFDKTMAHHQIQYIFLDINGIKGPPAHKITTFFRDWEIAYQDAWAIVFRKKGSL